MATAIAVKEPTPPAEFHYRQNADGTVDAICLRCFLTAATGTTVKELSKKELEHANYCFSRKCPSSVQFSAEQYPKRK
jgi:hypothetical protein